MRVRGAELALAAGVALMFGMMFMFSISKHMKNDRTHAPDHRGQTLEAIVGQTVAGFEKEAEALKSQSPSYQRQLKNERILNLLLTGQYAEVQRLMIEEKQLLPGRLSAGTAVAVRHWIDELGIQMKDIMPHFDAWVKAFPDSAVPYTARAVAYYYYAWKLRGEGYASETKKSNMQSFHALLEIGNDDIIKALSLDPREGVTQEYAVNYAFLLKGREGGMQAFSQATTSVPDYYPIYSAYLNFMQRKWMGRDGEALNYALDMIRKVPEDSILLMLPLEAYDDEDVWQRQRGDAEQEGFAAWWSGSDGRAKTTEEYYSDPVVWANVMALYERLMKHHPDITFITLSYAETLNNVGYSDQALEYYRRAVEKDPYYDRTSDRDPHGLYFIAWTYNVGRNQPDLAFPYYQKYSLLYPQDVSANNMLGFIYQNRRQIDKSLAHFTQASIADPRNVYALAHMCGGIFALMGPAQAEKALSYCNRAIAIDSADPEGYDVRAWVYDKVGNKKLATQDKAVAQKLRTAKKQAKGAAVSASR